MKRLSRQEEFSSRALSLGQGVGEGARLRCLCLQEGTRPPGSSAWELGDFHRSCSPFRKNHCLIVCFFILQWKHDLLRFFSHCFQCSLFYPCIYFHVISVFFFFHFYILRKRKCVVFVFWVWLILVNMLPVVSCVFLQITPFHCALWLKNTSLYTHMLHIKHICI